MSRPKSNPQRRVPDGLPPVTPYVPPVDDIQQVTRVLSTAGHQPMQYVMRTNILEDDMFIEHINELERQGFEVVDWPYGNKNHSSDGWMIMARRPLSNA